MIERIIDIPRHWAELSPEAPALWQDGLAVSFGELWRLIVAGSNWLRADGVVAGDRVMIVAENCVEEVALFFAISHLAAWPVLVNARMSAREIEVIRAHCTPRLMLFTAHVSTDAEGHARRHLAARSVHTDFCGIESSPRSTSAAPETADWAAEVAALIYTSGTTGTPKGVMVTHRGLLHFCGVSARSRQLSPADRVYAALPISHIFGIATIVLVTLSAGASVYIELRFDSKRAFDTLAAFDISILQGVPLLFRRLLTYLRETQSAPEFPRLRYLYIGGGALEPGLKADIEKAFELPLHHGYGMTEYAGSMFITRMDRPRVDCSSGEINLGCEARIVDSAGDDVVRGETGEIWVRGPGTMLGYYKSPDLTREVLSSDGWLKTGDLGRLADDGALFVVGRSKDLIKRSGFNVYPIEVEAVLNTHPTVRLSAVIGRALPDGDEEVIAFVEREQGSQLNLAQLQEFAKHQLSPYKRPAAIIEVDSLPLNINGKVLKQELRARLLSGMR